MNDLFLMDCTLRDGGYVNDWKFGAGSIKSIFSRLDKANMDMIEVGFIDDRRPYDPDRSIYPDTKSIDPVFKNMQKPHALVCAMIDFGTCNIENISPASESVIDGIRIIFKKHRQDEALAFIRQVKEKGYKVFINPVSVTSFSDEELISLITKINEIDPYAVTIVDTYGLMHSREVLHYCNVMDTYLNKGIILGYHAHNNFQLAYSNVIAVVDNIKNRPLAVDGTLFGMGKSAGNACTELIAMYLNEFYRKNYDINQIQEAIDIDITKEFKKQEWGYRPLFYISALHDCHPDYVTQFLDKKTLSVKQINELLKRIPQEKKLLYDKNLAETLYEEYQNREFDDRKILAELKKIFADSPLLLLGPGKSIVSEKAKIDDYIQKKQPILISVNFLNDEFPIDYVFMGNAKRYSQFFSRIYIENSKVKLICTSNITETKEKIDYKVAYAPLVTDVDCIHDNPLVLLLNLLIKLDIKNVAIAGFDGYIPDNSKNYYSDYTFFLFCQENVLLRNEAIKNFIRSKKDKISLFSITESLYTEGT